MALVLAGMALGRLNIGRLRTAVAALGIGVALMVVGYGLGGIGQAAGITGAVGGSSSAAELSSGSGSIIDGGSGSWAPQAGWEDYPQALAASDPLRAVLTAVFAVDPHSGGTAEILGSGGFALTIIALCLLLSRPLRWVLLPLGALGSMPLTAYSAHVLSIMVVGRAGRVLLQQRLLGRDRDRVARDHRRSGRCSSDAGRSNAWSDEEAGGDGGGARR